ncbi:MAG: endolytic transglycosylase MltG [Pseudomonadota bacterium]|nr:endolytic transglycosylase MltG [Pseudomonadota bacterium]
MRHHTVRFFAAVFLFAVFSATIGAVWVWRSYNSAGPLQTTARLVVQKGAALQEIASSLANKGIINSVQIFVLGAHFTGLARSMQAGEFALAPKMSMRGVTEHLARGQPVIRRFTVPEGLLTQEILGLLRNTEGLVGKVPAGLPEGEFLPETYFFTLGDTRSSLLRRMRSAMDSAIMEIWARRAAEIHVKTPKEAVILASLIEKETGQASERYRVSGVFHNRLRKGMRLQSDPTVAYALTGGVTPLRRFLTRKDLQINSLYNTYRVSGLPPGAITNPGRAALEAAVKPQQSKELFFVSDGKGGHIFAETLHQHNRNVADWRRLKQKFAP